MNFDLPFEINYQKLEPAGPNVGITEFNARQNVPPNWNAFIRVEASAQASGRVELWQNEVKIGDEEFILDAGESQRLVFELESQASSSETHVEGKEEEPPVAVARASPAAARSKSSGLRASGPDIVPTRVA